MRAPLFLEQRVGQLEKQVLSLTHQVEIMAGVHQLTAAQTDTERFDQILALLAVRYRFTVAQLKSHQRPADLVWARHLAVHVTCQLLPGLKQIHLGRLFNRDHSAVSYAICCVRQAASSDERKAAEISGLLTWLRSELKIS